MIFKNIDDKTHQIQILKELLEQSKSEAQKKLITADLKRMISGYDAETQNAYYLNFAFEKSKNVILLHDIRLEYEGRTAQFDHILISRLGIELLETKSAKGSLSINADGSLVIINGKFTNTYPNPLEQSKRHALVLREFIDAKTLFSKRIALFGGIHITNKVLIHPQTNITNSKLPDDFERGDSFVSNRSKDIDNISVFKAISLLGKAFDIDKAKELAQLLLDAHMPVEFDYRKKFKISKNDSTDLMDETPVAPIVVDEQSQEENSSKICPRCKEGELVSRKVKSAEAKEKYGYDEFIGCSRYPKCKYTQSVSETL
ncbi:MAG: NERD domain-containing protein [Sulfurimonas sp.]|jgi:hypothetical protein